MNDLPPIVLVAGWAHGAASLGALAARLAPLHRVETISVHELVEDLPGLTQGAQPVGLGSESASDYARGLAARLARYEVPAILVGWSMGGIVALETAIAFPRLAGRLVLVSATARFCATQDYPHGAQPAVLRAMTAGVRREREEMLRRFFALAHSLAATDDASPLRPSLDQAAALDADSLVHGLKYLQWADFRASLAKVSAPTLVIHGRQDQVIPWRAGQALCDGIPDCRLTAVDDGPHALPISDAELVARAILEFAEGEKDNLVKGGTSLSAAKGVVNAGTTPFQGVPPRARRATVRLP